MKITEVVREQAARICAAMAKDTSQVDEDVCRKLFGREVPAAIELAASAWLAVDPEPFGIEDPLDPKRELEAERMIRAGWSPGPDDDYEGEDE